MSSAIDSGIRVNLRMRFTCTVYRAIRPEDNAKGLKAVRKVGGEILMSEVGKAGWEALEGAGSAGGKDARECKRSEKEIMCFSTRPVEVFEVLNDLVVDRGPSPYVSMLELFGAAAFSSSTDLLHVLELTNTTAPSPPPSIRRRAPHDDRPGRRPHHFDSDGLDRLFALGRRLTRPPRDSGDSHHAYLPAHALIPANAPA